MKNIIISLIFLCICKLSFAQNNIEHPVSKIAVDHLFFLIDTKDTGVLNKLQEAGLTPATKWQTPHAGQGTTGNFFFFLNTYIELLVITDTAEASNNTQNFGHNINNRVRSGHSRLGIGLRQIPFKKDSIPFATQVYKQKWMGRESLYMATANINLQQPLIFLEPPAFANMVVEKLSDLDKYAAANPEMKTYRQHAAGMEKLTVIEIYTTDRKKKWGTHLKYLAAFGGITIKEAKTNYTVLVLDAGKQQKQIDLKKEIGLLIKY